MLRPVRQLTIKSVIFLTLFIAAVAGWLQFTLDYKLTKYIGAELQHCLVAALFWLLPLGASVFIREKVMLYVLSVMAYFAVVLSGLATTPNGPVFVKRVSWLIIGAMLPLFENSRGILFPLMFFAPAFLYGFIGPLFALTCRLRDDESS